MHIRLFHIKNRICAWDINDPKPTPSITEERGHLRCLLLWISSHLPNFPTAHLQKRLKGFKYIGYYEKMFTELFEKAEAIIPEANYDIIIKNTFGESSKAYRTYRKKASAPQKSSFQPTLYIDFEAIDMNICGWYGELVLENETVIYEGIAKPFSNLKHLERVWNKVYANLLHYNLDDIKRAKHVRTFENYFVTMFSKAKRIVTYGDTDALFIQKSFGDDMFNFFKIKNVDASFRSKNRIVSLDKLSKLCNVHVDGLLHDPKYDVQVMRKCIDVIQNL